MPQPVSRMYICGAKIETYKTQSDKNEKGTEIQIFNVETPKGKNHVVFINSKQNHYEERNTTRSFKRQQS